MVRGPQQLNQGGGLVKNLVEGFPLLQLPAGAGQQLGLECLGLAAGQHLLRHVVHQGRHAHDDALLAVGLVGERDVARAAGLQLGQRHFRHYLADAGEENFVEQLHQAHHFHARVHLGHGVALKRAGPLLGRKQLGVRRVEVVDAVVGLAQQHDGGRGLLEYLEQVLPGLGLALEHAHHGRLQGFGLLAGPHLIRHVQAKNQDALGALLPIYQRLVDEVDVALLGLAGGVIVQHHQGFGADKRLAGAVHLVEQANEALLRYFRKHVGHGVPQHGAPGRKRLVSCVEKGKTMLGARERRDGGRHLAQNLAQQGLLHALQLAALPLGFGAGGLLAGLARAQRGFRRRARVGGRIQEADNQLPAEPPGGQVEIIIEAIGLVAEVELPCLARFEHAPVEIKNAVGKRAGEVRPHGAARVFGQARQALRGRVEVIGREIDQLTAFGRVYRAQQVEGRERYLEHRAQQAVGGGCIGGEGQGCGIGHKKRKTNGARHRRQAGSGQP